jgi:hypothetical protein
VHAGPNPFAGKRQRLPQIELRGQLAHGLVTGEQLVP